MLSPSGFVATNTSWKCPDILLKTSSFEQNVQSSGLLSLILDIQTALQFSSDVYSLQHLFIIPLHSHSSPEGSYLVHVKIVCVGVCVSVCVCVCTNLHYPDAAPGPYLPIKPIWSYEHRCTRNSNPSNGSSAECEWLNASDVFRSDPRWGARTLLSVAMKPIKNDSMMDSCSAIKCKARYWRSRLSMFL